MSFCPSSRALEAQEESHALGSGEPSVKRTRIEGSAQLVNDGNYRVERRVLEMSLRLEPRQCYDIELGGACAALPDDITVQTLNVAGATDAKHLLQRMKHCAFQGKDIVCLQEYKADAPPDIPGAWYCSAIPSCVKQDVFTVIASAYVPRRVSYWEMPGCLGYSNSLVMAQWSNLTVINCYWQAGSQHSFGLWPEFLPIFHDVRTRAFKFALELATQWKAVTGGRVVICGDFNSDWNGAEHDWPEYGVMRASSLESVFPKAYSEDSETNLIRKAKRTASGSKPVKQAVVDGFFVGGVVASRPRLTHTETFMLDGCAWHVSDHFGVAVDIRL